MLNVSKGNMYPWITHTWNTVKGACPHDCSYCYMKRFGNQKPIRFDEKELKTDLGKGNFIFVGSSCDMWAQNIPENWIFITMGILECYENKYLFQSKNPSRMIEYLGYSPSFIDAVICTTIETNRWYPEIMRDCPTPFVRSAAMELARRPRYVTIEPIMDFDLVPMVELIKRCNPIQVNIGADSGRNGLPEPSRQKVEALIQELQKFTTIARKSNLERLMSEK